MEGDNDDRLRPGRYHTKDAAEWQDLYAVIQVVKELCLCHIEFGPPGPYDEEHVPETVPGESETP